MSERVCVCLCVPVSLHVSVCCVCCAHFHRLCVHLFQCLTYSRVYRAQLIILKTYVFFQIDQLFFKVGFHIQSPLFKKHCPQVKCSVVLLISGVSSCSLPPAEPSDISSRLTHTD